MTAGDFSDVIAQLTLRLDVNIRVAQAEDIDRLEWYGQFTHYRNLFRRSFREQLQGRRLLLVAESGGFPIGRLFIQFRSDNTMIADGYMRAYFYSFQIMEMFRGGGLGTRLMQEGERILHERGFRQATVAVAKENTGALRLYQRLGYSIFAEDAGRWHYRDHRGILREVDEPCWLLEKILSSG